MVWDNFFKESLFYLLCSRDLLFLLRLYFFNLVMEYFFLFISSSIRSADSVMSLASKLKWLRSTGYGIFNCFYTIFYLLIQPIQGWHLIYLIPAKWPNLLFGFFYSNCDKRFLICSDNWTSWGNITSEYSILHLVSCYRDRCS